MPIRCRKRVSRIFTAPGCGARTKLHSENSAERPKYFWRRYGTDESIKRSSQSPGQSRIGISPFSKLKTSVESRSPAAASGPPRFSQFPLTISLPTLFSLSSLFVCEGLSSIRTGRARPRNSSANRPPSTVPEDVVEETLHIYRTKPSPLPLIDS
jgi:hypothetical protein